MVGVPEVEWWVFVNGVNTGQWWVCLRWSSGWFAHGVNMGHWWVFLRWTVIKVMGVSA